MLYQELLIQSTTIILTSVLVVDTLLRPKQIYRNWLRNRGIKRVLSQFKSSKGNWIIVAGTEKSGKSSILQSRQWQHLKTMFIGPRSIEIWQHKDNPLWALEISFPDMGSISDEWWQSLKKLCPKRIYYFLTIDECKRFKAKHMSRIETHVIISHADKIQGFSPFMSSITDESMTFPIGQSQTNPYTNGYLHEAFEKLYAQLQTYGNKLLNKMTSPEMKKIINDFPQHCLNLQLGLNKVIAAMPVKQIYCYGQIWQNGTPKMLFSPTLGSDLNVIKTKTYGWRKFLLITTLFLIAAQVVLFKQHIKNIWNQQPLTQLTKAQSEIEVLEQKKPIFKFIAHLISPTFSLSNQQLDEANQIAYNYLESIEKMSPIIAALDIRSLDKTSHENPKLNKLIQEILEDKRKVLQDVWNSATNKEQFIASLHYMNGSINIDDPLPKMITNSHIKTACLALTNRLSTEECIKQSVNWMQPDFKSVSNFDDLIKKLETQPFDAKLKPLIQELTAWLQTISKNPKRTFVAFEFLVKHMKNPDSNHILMKIQNYENTFPEVENILQITWQLLLDEAGKYMNSIWVKTIHPYYKKQFANSYPIDKDSAKDVSLNAFNQFYGTGGLINIYYNSYIMPFVDTHVQTFKTIYPGTVFPIRDEHLSYFKAVSAVQTLLYQGDTSAHLEINLLPIYDKETWLIKSNEITIKMDAPVIIGWPSGISQNGFSIYNGKKKVSEFKGIWGFWRWFESGNYANNEIAFPNHSFKISGQTESDLNWLGILRSQKPKESLL